MELNSTEKMEDITMAQVITGRTKTDAISKDDLRRMERSAKNKLYAMNNVSKLREKYADKYIALDRGKVLASGGTPEEVFARLRGSGIPDFSFVAVEFIPKDRVIWLL